jgi:6-hydroxycyclohex-1-ene-1-carbonyl-CoA dehydrogenase
MKAGRFYEKGNPIILEDIEVPQLYPSEVLIRVAGCGICSTEIAHLDLGVPTIKNPPVILGHEISGTVVERGRNVTEVDKGDRVLLPVYFTCGKCPSCRTGRENLCYNMKILGNHIDGGFAEFIKAPSKDVIPLPSRIPLEDACIITDCMTTPYHALVHRARLIPGETVAVIGCGNIGINAVQIAAAMGASVMGVDVHEKRRDLALELGAFDTLDGSTDIVSDEVKRLTRGGADVVIDCAGTADSLHTAYECMRVGGRLIMVGTPQDPVPLNFVSLMYFETAIIGSLGCRTVDYSRVIGLVGQGTLKLEPVIDQKMNLEKINEALDIVRTSHEGKVIITP